MQKGTNKTSRFLFLGGLLTLPGIIAGCAIGIGALIVLVALFRRDPKEV